MSNIVVKPLEDHPIDYVDIQNEYKEIIKLSRDGLHVEEDHGKCVLNARWTETAHKMYLSTALWLDDKYRMYMELLQTVLAEELVAMHHLTMEEREKEVKKNCDEMDKKTNLEKRTE